VERYTELRLFEHVRPDQRLSAPDLALDLLRLYRHLWLVAQEAL
jgi:hypothetical protein